MSVGRNEYMKAANFRFSIILSDALLLVKGKGETLTESVLSDRAGDKLRLKENEGGIFMFLFFWITAMFVLPFVSLRQMEKTIDG